MTNSVEDATARFLEFVGKADQHASGLMPPMMQRDSRPGPRKGPRQQVYETCLGKLTDAERNTLDGLIEKMRGAIKEPERPTF
jgi:hypothetical protein